MQLLVWLAIVQPYVLRYINAAEMGMIVLRLIMMVAYVPLCIWRVTESLCDKLDSFLIIFMIVVKIALIGMMCGRIAHGMRYRPKSDGPRNTIGSNNTSTNELVTTIA